MSQEAMYLLAAFALDLALGDPRWLPHPVRGFGRLAAWLERAWRQANGISGMRAAGGAFAITAISAAAAIVWVSVESLRSYGWPAAALTVYWAYSMLAVRGLDVESRAVIEELRRSDLPAARGKLARIVGRDTNDLDENEIVRAVIETMAENISDGVVAPLFYFTLAGPVGMAVYKATNTLDSMVGYKNERYRDFGWASARLDDVLNFVPARLTAALMWAASACLGLDLRRSVQTVWRDASHQPSPNAGYPEAAVAGALRVRLGGVNYYGGMPSSKPPLGDPVLPLTVDSFRPTRRMLYVTAILAVALGAFVSAWRWF